MHFLKEALQSCRAGHPIAPEIVPALLEELLDAKIDLQLKADFLSALSDKGETAEELSAFVEALLPKAVHPGFEGYFNGKALFDCAGAGGGGLSLINISTGIIFILGALDIPVVKHGNRGVTKKSGSADVLEALGLKIHLSPTEVKQLLEEIGITFIFAPAYHPAFALLAPVREFLGRQGRRTIFNLLGPLINPARPAAQMVGVSFKEQLALYEKTFSELKKERYLIVFGLDQKSNRALGEVSVTGSNQFKFKLSETIKLPESWPVPAFSEDLKKLEVNSAAESAARLLALFKSEEKGIACEFLLANAAAAAVTQGRFKTYEESRIACEEILDSGKALMKLERWRALKPKL